ncbi:MAG: short-chain fatty acyl-CoA regulator family protein, partial [Pseudomonadota bacterium]
MYDFIIAGAGSACPRWNVLASFLTPASIRIQLSRMPDGAEYFCFARTLRKEGAGFRAPHPVLAIGMGCKL